MKARKSSGIGTVVPGTVEAVQTGDEEAARLDSETWLIGLETETVGGIYEFDTIDNARSYVESYLFDGSKTVGGAGTLLTRIYDGAVTQEASLDMSSLAHAVDRETQPGPGLHV